MASEAVKRISELGDPTLIPRLRSERQRIVDRLESQCLPGTPMIDTSQRTVEFELTQAIVWLLSADDLECIRKDGSELERFMADRRIKKPTFKEYWGYL